MLSRIVVVLVFGASACGPANERPAVSDAGPDAGPGTVDGGVPGANGEDQPIQFMSGTRIKARATNTMITTADGASYKSTAFAGWFDAQRNEACSPQLAADGKTRCLPAAIATSNYYSDAACSMPIVIASTPTPVCGGSGMLKYIAISPAPACPTTVGPTLHHAGTIGTTYYIKGTNGTCSGPTTADGYTWASLGAEIPPDEFVEMTTTTTTQ
jgi:hypothetical protein